MGQTDNPGIICLGKIKGLAFESGVRVKGWCSGGVGGWACLCQHT